MAAILRASYPINFQLLNRDRQPILGIFDGQQGQTLKLEITNSSSRNLTPKKLAGQNATADNHHFELLFRPGTLVLPDSASPNRPAISVAEPGWKISDKPVVSDTGISFYLLITDPTTIETGKSTSVTLNNLSGDGKVGAHGTRVELKWQNSLEYVASGAGQSPESLVPGHRLQHLSVVNQSGQQQIPLHIGIVGNDKVLNNGKENELKLRITSLLNKDEGNIELNPGPDPKPLPATKFILSFDASAKGSAPNPWALGFTDQVSTININAGTKFNTPSASLQGQSVQWTLWPTEAITLRPGESIEVNITKIVTEHPSGLTNLYIKYKNIPGYWDGDFVAYIEKAPLVYGSKGVGIGTNDPKESLHVAGKLRVDNEVSLREKVTVDKLRVEKDVSVGGEGIFTVDAPMDPGGRLRIDTESKVTVKKLRVEKDVSVGGTGVFEIDADRVPAGRLKIDTDGKVGIGTAIPEKHLHVAGTDDQEVLIQSTNGVKWSLQSSGSSGRFEILNRTANQNRFTILKDGNIGIGTTDPGGHINTGNYFKADKDGRILEVHSPNHESVLILSTAQDKDGAHLGGLYFTRTKGQDDAHREVAAIKCKQLFEQKLAGGILQFFTKPASGGANFDNPRMVIRENGNVGIGTADPNKASLEVATSIGTEVNGYLYLSIVKLDRQGSKTTQPYSIWAQKRIAAEEFNAVSDERIKNIRGRSDGATDLSTLLGIEITDYSFRDVIGKGAGNYKKVIGQQVEKVFPQAVSKQTDFVPDIYQQAPNRDGWVTLATDLKQGDRVKLITEKGEGVYEVLEAIEDKFRVDGEPEGEKVFVFGREVNDLHVVDYDAIAMLNVSATQQLKKEMDQELKALRVENAELRSANEALATRLQLLERKLETSLGVVAAQKGANGNGRH